MATKKKTTRKKTTNKKRKKQQIDKDVKRYLIGIAIIVFTLIALFKQGSVGSFLYDTIHYVFGISTALVLIIFIVFAIQYIFIKKIKLPHFKLSIFILLSYISFLTVMTSLETKLVGISVINDYLSHTKELLVDSTLRNGGLLGSLLYGILSLCFDKIGTYLILGIAMLVSLTLLLNEDHKEKIRQSIQDKKADREVLKANRRLEKEQRRAEALQAAENDLIDEYADEEINNEPTNRSIFIEADNTNTLVDEPVEEVAPMEEITTIEEVKDDRPIYTENTAYELPKMNLLKPAKKMGKNPNTAYAQEAGKKLIKVLQQFKVQASLVATHIGPTITKFEIKPEEGTRVSKISNLAQDIKMGLAAKEIRIEAPIPGKNTVGIEIPNQEKSMVTASEILSSKTAMDSDAKMLFALGKGLTGEPVCGRLDKMPHMLIAGATGSGKSVCVNSIIISILMRAKPDEVKLLLIDPKKVEFTPFRDLPHLIAPVITDAEEASRALKVIVEIMDKRYDVFAKAGVRNIEGYNDYIANHPEEPLKPMPQIAVIIDELADLMLVAAKDVESSIQRITQLARAAGIHLIVATQRPSVDVITGIIKANIPSRIAFAVSSAVDSRTILDATGAEQLLGLGDMLYMPRGESNPIRLQGCFVSDEEVARVASFCASQAKPKYEDIFLRLDQVDRNALGAATKCDDPIYEDAKRFVIETGKASVSLLQRKFSLGYSRAARLIDMLEAEGVVGPSNGSKPREVYIKSNSEE